MNGRFSCFPLFLHLFRPRLDDRFVTTGYVSLRFGVGTSWLVTTLRIFISFDRYSSPLFRRDYRLQLGDGRLEWSHRRSSCTVPLWPKKTRPIVPASCPSPSRSCPCLRPFNIQAYFRPSSLIPRLSTPCPIRYLIKQEKNYFSSNPSEITGSPLCFTPLLIPIPSPPEEMYGSAELRSGLPVSIYPSWRSSIARLSIPCGDLRSI